jgi:hypothetical protein
LFYKGELRATHGAKAALTYPDGTLIKAPEERVYLLEEGRKRPIPTPGVLKSRFKETDAVVVTNDQLAAYPDGEAVSYRDGSLINVPGGPVWVVSEGKRLGFASAEIFERLSYSWSRVKPVTDAELRLHPEGPPITQVSATHPNGSLVKAGGPEVYLVEGGQKRLIPSPGIFSSRFDEADIISVTDAELAAYPSGEKVGFRDGSLLRGPDGSMFVVSRGRRRPISAGRFGEYHYSGANLRQASREELEIHPQGDPL